MEFFETGIAILERAESQAAEPQVVELNDLQLAVVGGGAGDVAFG